MGLKRQHRLDELRREHARLCRQRRQTGGSTAYDEIRRVEAAIRDLLRGGGSQKRLLKLQRRPKR